MAQPLTNAALVAHYAALPPDQTAHIFLLDGDTGTMNEEFFYLTTTDDLARMDDANQDALGKPHVWIED